MIQQQFHLISFDDQSVISYYPIQIKYKDIISILGVVMLIGFLAAIYPVKVFTKNNLLQQ
jgi:ABC-type lipoprotein release transport system permease subunit